MGGGGEKRYRYYICSQVGSFLETWKAPENKKNKNKRAGSCQTSVAVCEVGDVAWWEWDGT